MMLRGMIGFLRVARNGLFMLLPLVLLFGLFQTTFLRLPRAMVRRIYAGFGWTFVGLTLFLYGVGIGYLPAGARIGEGVASSRHAWRLIPVGLLLGFVVTWAEPAVRILNIEVEKVTSGHIQKRLLTVFLALGVALAVGLSMLRILVGIPLWLFVLPGYLAALVLSFRVEPVFVAVAFDSGGVVTGPMIATFILALCVSAAETVPGADPLLDGFGMIALVAMVPILTILTLGVIYKRRTMR